MHSEASAAEQTEQIPRVAPGRDPSALPLSPAEGFLLSRIDGHTSWRLLRDIAGIPAEEVDRTLERWVEDGLLILEAGGGDLTPSREASNAEPQAGAVDAGVDLPEA